MLNAALRVWQWRCRRVSFAPACGIGIAEPTTLQGRHTPSINLTVGS